MNFLPAVIRLAIVVALLPIALDWRSPSLAAFRLWALSGLVAFPLAVAISEIRVWRTSGSGSRIAGALHAATLAIAIVVLAFTLTIEARFLWIRQQVLGTDPSRLEMLGRHLIVGYRDLAELHALIDRRAVSGVFIAAHNVGGRTIDDIRQSIDALQALRRRQHLPPLWIATDQEGGPVSRLAPPLARSASLSAIVDSHSDMAERSLAVRQFASGQARELAQVGINVNFAPVVDLNHRLVNPADRYTRIYQRAISSDPRIVTDVARQYCTELWQAGIRCTLKHFPGLGRVFEDTHRESADLVASTAELEATDWIPFRALMQDGSAFIMLGHARLTAIDRERPVSFSQRVVAHMIRGAWQHDGILVTDDFCMAAVYDSPGGIGLAGIEALNAGVDLILVSFDPDQYYPIMYSLLQAETDGRLRQDILRQSEKRLSRAINQAVRRPAMAGAP
jgi:beta-N-acetylhexosaminidase